MYICRLCRFKDVLCADLIISNVEPLVRVMFRFDHVVCVAFRGACSPLRSSSPASRMSLASLVRVPHQQCSLVRCVAAKVRYKMNCNVLS